MRDYFLETNRILFSHWTKNDINLASSLWGENDVVKYISKTGQFSENEISERLDLEINNEKKFGVQYWPFFEKKTNGFIGCCGLRPYNVDSKRVLEKLGFKHVGEEYYEPTGLYHPSYRCYNSRQLFMEKDTK